MNVFEFTSLVGLSSLAAGFLGALTGLGGGVVIVPLLALVFSVDIRYAIGASLVSVTATSSGAAAAYVREGFSNIRIGMFLEVATTLGALVGASLAPKISTGAIGVIFGVVLMDRIRGRLLRAGVMLAAVVVLAGNALYLTRHGGATPDYRVFRGEPADLRSVSGVLNAALTLHGRGLIQLGLLLLIATPVAQVIFSVLAFALQRDRTYVAVSLIVLAVLLYSLAGGSL
jgi:uncharacterized membrane protein